VETLYRQIQELVAEVKPAGRRASPFSRMTFVGSTDEEASRRCG
jgi:hypothetical protein